MLFVIEGLDRTGKSRLARRIATKIGGRVIHAGPPKRGSIEEYETSLNDYDPTSGEHFILDRWHIGETVWPKIFGRQTDMDLAVKRHVTMFMESRGAVTIYGRRDLDKLRHEMVKYDEPLHPDKVYEADQRFKSYRETYGTTKSWLWDYESDGDDKVSKIIAHAQEREELARQVWKLCGPGYICGSLTPIVLLVGDEQGPKKDNRNEPYKIPFAPFMTTSGHYLLCSLENWKETFIINASDRDEKFFYDIYAVWRGLDYPAVIALGNAASKHLEHLEVPHSLVPHPQYWRRFHYHDKDLYTYKLEVAGGF